MGADQAKPAERADIVGSPTADTTLASARSVAKVAPADSTSALTSPTAASSQRSMRPVSESASQHATPSCAEEPHERKVPREASPPIVVERAAALFRALGDTARLSLLERLAGGEYCVTELAEATGEGLSTISQRLRTLRSEHLLRRRRVGKHVYYTLADHHVTDLIRSALEHAREQR